MSFRSDSSESPLGLCASVPDGCLLTENGDVQIAGFVTWTALVFGEPAVVLRTDTIEFASDITDVPDPASWLLVLSGLPLLGLRRLSPPCGVVRDLPNQLMMLGMVVVVAQPGWGSGGRGGVLEPSDAVRSDGGEPSGLGPDRGSPTNRNLRRGPSRSATSEVAAWPSAA